MEGIFVLINFNKYNKMKISYNWLQKYFYEKLPSKEDVISGITFHSFEIEGVEDYEDDTILDIKILPDRAHDCLSHFGIAKELSTIFNIPIKDEYLIDFTKGVDFKNTGDNASLSISINSDKCRRYMGRVIKGVRVKPSPLWLKNALISIGQKSINNIVDATNYVMFDLGNPIHAFDLNKLENANIRVENAYNGEKITLLDGKEVELDESVLTIRDDAHALALAGIKGGKKAEIDDHTVDIVIEVANFDPVCVRKTTRALSINTDSSKRFENELNPKISPFVMDAISKLILEVAGGETKDVVDISNYNPEDKNITFTLGYINNILGSNITDVELESILSRFNFEYEKDEIEYKITVPTLRLDLTDKHDVVEEIGRIYGYDKIDTILPNVSIEQEDGLIWKNICLAKEKLVKDGYKEVMTYDLRDSGDIEIMASASDKNFLRNNLKDGLLESIKLNIPNLPLIDLDNIKVFEIGAIFKKSGEEIHVAFGDKKNIQEFELNEFIEKENLSNNSVDIYSLSKDRQNYFKMWSVYPFISRDISVWVKEGTRPSVLQDIYTEFGTELLVKEPRLFDSFSKDGRTSLAFRLVFQSYDKTLKDEEVNSIMEKIEEKITSLGYEIR